MRAGFRLLILLTLSLSAQATTTPAGEPIARRGRLFSAILCAETPLGIAWAHLLGEAHQRFPRLRFTSPENLHVTVVYIGPHWRTETLPQLRPLALTAPAEPITFTPEVATLGAAQDVVAVELRTPSTAWHTAVTNAKAELNRLHLKSPDRYDANFRPHLTLAQSTRRPPDAADAAELRAFREWLQAEVTRHPEFFTITLGPNTRVRLLLAGLPGPPTAPTYLPLEEFLQHPATK